MTTKVDTNTFKSAIQNASGHAQATVAKTETAAVAAVDRVEDAFASVKSSFEGVKAFGSNLTEVVDNAGRTAMSGVVAMNGSLMTYGKDLITDTIDLGRKTIETRSLKDAVDLHTSFAERRIQAVFHTAAQINTLAQDNVMAMFTPFASMIRTAGTSADVTATNVKKSAFKTAA